MILLKSTLNEYLTTIEQEKQDKRISLSLEYSENKEKLKELLKELTIEIKSIGYAIDYPEYREWSNNENMNLERIVYLVVVKRKDKRISFKFCDSYNNAINGKKPDLYSILASIGSEYDYNNYSFEDFCSEYGYDTDSHKSDRIYKNWTEHNVKLKQIFQDQDIEVLPH